MVCLASIIERRGGMLCCEVLLDVSEGLSEEEPYGITPESDKYVIIKDVFWMLAVDADILSRSSI